MPRMQFRVMVILTLMAGCGSVSKRPNGDAGTGGADAAPGGATGADAAAAGGSGGGGTDALPGDAATGDRPDGDAGCVPETNAQFCARLGKSCEMVSGTDNCGAARTVGCGTCATGMGCVDQVCKTPVCTTFNYSTVAFAPFSRASAEDVMISASATGQSILYGQSPVGACGSFQVFLADETAPGTGTYTTRNVTSLLVTNNVIVGEGALSGDGLTFIAVAADRKSFMAARRSALQLIDFVPAPTADLAAVNGFVAGTAGMFRIPVISADGLELYYTINGISTAADGIYRSVRASASSPFPVGARVTALTSDYEFVTGISSDRLALFMFKGFAGFIFTRASTSAEFANPNAPNPPPQIANWQHKPFRDCATLAAMASAGGCANEDIVFMYRQP